MTTCEKLYEDHSQAEEYLQNEHAQRFEKIKEKGCEELLTRHEEDPLSIKPHEKELAEECIQIDREMIELD